jgi:HEAT repeat protein
LARGCFFTLTALLTVIGCARKLPFEGKSVAELQTMLQDSDPAIQAQGAFGLSRLGAESAPAVPALIESLQSPDPLVRQHSALALGEIGPEAAQAVQALMGALADPEWTVRRQAALALGRLGERARPSVGPLRKLQRRDPNSLVRKAAQEALGKIEAAGK